MIDKLKLDLYVEDNWDIVSYLNLKSKIKIFWIYNILDRNKRFLNKFPSLNSVIIKIKELIK